METKNVHTEHCCVIHGCKYDNDNCPVWIGIQRQSYPCPYCDNEHPECGVSSSTIPDMPNEMELNNRKKQIEIEIIKEMEEFDLKIDSMIFEQKQLKRKLNMLRYGQIEKE